MREIDYLVAGQGLAGSVFALQALERGRSVLVVDPCEAVTSSRVAAGIINPLTGPRLNKGWRIEQLLPAAETFYRAQERALGVRFYDPLPILRLFVDDAQARKSLRAETADFRAPLPGGLEPFHTERGGFLTQRSARLRMDDFLLATRWELERGGSFMAGRIHPSETVFTPEHVTWRNEIRARRLVCCQGHESIDQPWFGFVPLRRGKGEILRLRVPDLLESRIVSRHKWLLPEGGQAFQAGATFSWDTADASPTAEGRTEIESDLAKLLRLPWEVTGHMAGIRPMANRGRPILGSHPGEPALAFLNGFGAKGALLAPFFAAHLLDHLEDGIPIDEEVDVRRFGS